jgi:hypothetical protein
MAHAEALVENDVFVENGVFLPMESVEEVKLFAEKIGTNQKFRELSVNYFFSYLFIYSSWKILKRNVYVQTETCVSFVFSNVIIQIEYLKSNLARVFPNCPDSFITAAYCAMFSARLTFESHDTSVKCCWRVCHNC